MQYRRLGRTGPKVSGFLTGKYRRDQPVPKSGRAEGVQNRYFNERGWRLIECVTEIAERHGATAAQVPLSRLLARPSVTAPITAANTVEQWEDLAGAVDVRLSPEDVAALDDVSNWT